MSIKGTSPSAEKGKGKRKINTNETDTLKRKTENDLENNFKKTLDQKGQKKIQLKSQKTKNGTVPFSYL